jgi:two-component system, sporulation sensor kinase E
VKNVKRSHILIVDDNPSNLLTLEAILKPLNQILVYARSGKEALKQVLKYDFSVILMDAHMPELDGFETVKLIRMRDKSCYTPIIFLSAYHQDEINVNQGYEIGAVDYILKPINPMILKGMLS